MTHKILVVDPEPDTLRYLQAGLEQAGYQVITAQDGEQALARDSAERPDLVCVEIHLGDGAGGFEVCRAIKATRTVPVLLTVSRLDDETSAGFLSAGAEDLIFKPLELDEVIDKVAWFLNPQD